jgi:CRISPR/Cas system-associated exonuclease Cas4 (RecB family)
LIPHADVQVIDLAEEHRQAVIAALAAVREAVTSQRMPPPTPVRARCSDCEYRNYCADIW